MPEQYYTLSQACRALGIQPGTFKTLIDKGRVQKVVPPHHKRRALYPKSQVDQVALEMAAFKAAS